VVSVKRAATLLQVLSLFANPLVIILFIASLVSAIIRDFVNAAIIIGIALLNNTLNFRQTARTERAAERPLAALLEFTPLPLYFLLFLVITAGVYLLFVEVIKRRLMRRQLR
jgi:magnesium-transporting ATPase (P-type)